MRYSLTLLFLFLLPPAFADQAFLNSQLSVVAKCNNNPHCKTTEDFPILINIEISNQNLNELECEFSRVEMMGPWTRLIDRHTGGILQLRAAAPVMVDKTIYTKLKPGEIWHTNFVIYPEDMRRVRPGIIDFDAHITINVAGRNIETGEPITCAGETSLRIAENPEE